MAIAHKLFMDMVLLRKTRILFHSCLWSLQVCWCHQVTLHYYIPFHCLMHIFLTLKFLKLHWGFLGPKFQKGKKLTREESHYSKGFTGKVAFYSVLKNISSFCQRNDQITDWWTLFYFHLIMFYSRKAPWGPHPSPAFTYLKYIERPKGRCLCPGGKWKW